MFFPIAKILIVQKLIFATIAKSNSMNVIFGHC